QPQQQLVDSRVGRELRRPLFRAFFAQADPEVATPQVIDAPEAPARPVDEVNPVGASWREGDPTFQSTSGNDAAHLVPPGTQSKAVTREDKGARLEGVNLSPPVLGRDHNPSAAYPLRVLSTCRQRAAVRLGPFVDGGLKCLPSDRRAAAWGVGFEH